MIEPGSINSRIRRLAALVAGVFILIFSCRAGGEDPGFSVGCIAIGTEATQNAAYGERFLGELVTRTQANPKIPEAWRALTSDFQTAPPFLWVLLGAQAPIPPGFAARLQRFIAQGGTVFAEADGRPGSAARLVELREATLGAAALKELVEGDLLTRTFYLLPAQALTDYHVLHQAGRVVWIDSAGPLLRLIGEEGGERRELCVRTGINLVIYTLTGSYKDDLTHVRYLMRRRKNP